MNSARQMLFLLGGAALLTASFAVVPPPAYSCGDKDNCACGAACPSMAEGAEKGACACGAGAEGAKAEDHAQGEGGCAHAAAMAASAGTEKSAGLRAEIDPETGELTVPRSGTAGIPPTAASATAPAAEAVQVPLPGGGMMAAVPPERTSHAVATIDATGNTNTGCAE